MKNKKFSWARLWAMIKKEFIQMGRDKPTLAIMVGIPILQVMLFGYAINNDPKHLPAAVVSADSSQFTRTLVQGMQNSGYFEVEKRINSEDQAKEALAEGKLLFIINIPPDFSQKLLKGERPNILLEADATDPGATNNAISAMRNLLTNVFQYDFIGSLSYLQPEPLPVNLVVHPKYNPAGITQYNIVTGLLGVVVTMTMVMITAIAITRERDRGTMESLLASPITPLEIMLGKTIPYILVGCIEGALILFIAWLLFSVPLQGSILLLFLLSLPFIAANLLVGITISTFATNPLQATQIAIFYYLPSLLLSGFMFPFYGMPKWAQWIGQVLPLTHYLRITRGILLKANHFPQMLSETIPIILFLLVVIAIGVLRFRRTLD